MAEYRELRSRHSFLELCKRPELATEVTLYACERLGVDAAILFADILLIVECMGLSLTFNAGEGPVIGPPVRTAADLARLRPIEAEALQPVYDAVRLIRNDLPREKSLIGFAGAPFTVAAYCVEGGLLARVSAHQAPHARGARGLAFSAGPPGSGHGRLPEPTDRRRSRLRAAIRLLGGLPVSG